MVVSFFEIWEQKQGKSEKKNCDELISDRYGRHGK
jgi:hypothetical protein